MTAAERAAEVLDEAKERWLRDAVVPPMLHDAQVAALLRHPALLVDLAIEAGGLEPARAAGQGPQLHLDPAIASVNWGAATLPTDVPLWVRRTTTEDQP